MGWYIIVRWRDWSENYLGCMIYSQCWALWWREREGNGCWFRKHWKRSDLGGVQLWVHTCWLVGALRCWHPDIVTLLGNMFRESRNFRTMNISLWVICIYSIVELSNSIQTYFNLANTVLYGKNFLNSTWLSKCIHWERKWLDLFTVGALLHGWDTIAKEARELRVLLKVYWNTDNRL